MIRKTNACLALQNNDYMELKRITAIIESKQIHVARYEQHMFYNHELKSKISNRFKFELNKENGLFLGLFLAEENVDILSGYIQITNNENRIFCWRGAIVISGPLLLLYLEAPKSANLISNLSH